MRNKSKMLCLIGVTALSSLLLSSCGFTTTKSIANDVQENLANVTSVRGSTKLDLALSVNTGEKDSEISEYADMNFLSNFSDKDAKAMKLSGDSKLSILGVNSEINEANYFVMEKGTCYRCEPETSLTGVSKWTKYKSDENCISEFSDIADTLIKFYNYYTLDKGKTLVADRECYVLKGEISSKSLNEIINVIDSSNSTSVSSLFNADKNVVADVTYYVDSDTNLPVQIVIDLSKSNFVVKNGDKDCSIKNVNMTYTITYDAFNDNAEVVLPDDLDECSYDNSEPSELPASYSLDKNATSSTSSSTVSGNSASTSESTPTNFTINVKGKDASTTELGSIDYMDNYYPHTFESDTFALEDLKLSTNSDKKVYYKITNITDKTVCADGLVRFYNADGKTVDVKTVYIDALGAGKSIVEVYTTSVDYASYDLSLISDTCYATASDLSYTVNSTDKGIFDITVVNNGKDACNYLTLGVLVKSSGSSDAGEASAAEASTNAEEAPKYSAYNFDINDTDLAAGASKDIKVSFINTSDVSNYEVLLNGYCKK